MRFGFLVTAGDPRTGADLAAEAEATGWDGVFSWDGIAIGEGDTYDPWVTMAAMAMRTDEVRLGAILTPPSRRRPWKLARETMTLDRLSGGSSGATWWIESDWTAATVESLRRRIAAGPPHDPGDQRSR